MTKRPSAVTTLVAGLAACVGLSLAFSQFGFGALYTVKAAAVFGVVMLVALASLDRHHPFAQFGSANRITTIRAACASLVVGGIGEGPTALVGAVLVGVGAVAALLDGLDGWLARRTRMASPFGARFDMETDALLILGLSVLAWQHGKAGAWVVASGLLRYAFVAGGWIWPWLARPLPPSRRRQTICVVQVVVLLLVVSPVVVFPASAVLAAAALVTLALSFFVDARRLWRDADGHRTNFPRQVPERTKPLVS